MSATLPDHRSGFQTVDDLQWNVSHSQPYSGAESSVACIHPRMDRPKRRTPVSHTQSTLSPEIDDSVNGLYGIDMLVTQSSSFQIFMIVFFFGIIFLLLLY